MLVLNRLLGRLLKKKWTEDHVRRYIGSLEQTYLAYASDGAVREKAASGGVVSALLLQGLASGAIDGAVVCCSRLVDGKVRPVYRIATDAAGVLEARGSQYVEAPYQKEVLPLLQTFEGKLAVVGLPCEIDWVARLAKKDPAIGEKVVLKIALCCGSCPTAVLADHVTERLEKLAGAELEHFFFRQGHWRGRMRALFTDGQVLERPFADYSLYHNLFFFPQEKCLYCHDHFGYQADFSVGDVWAYELKNDPIKHSGVIAKNPEAMAWIARTQQSGVIAWREVPVGLILDGQARIAPFHYNLSAKHHAGKRLGIAIPDSLHEKVRWRETQVACMRLKNYLAGKRNPERIFRLPRWYLKMKLLFLKMLESL